MKTRCPCCGAENSLDALLSHEEARHAMWALATLSGEVGRLAVQYLALFRPKNSSLSWGRLVRLMNDLLPDMQRQAITRDRVEYPAPAEAWVYAFAEMINKRNSGSLKLPLKSHGYLYEIIASWQGQGLRPGPHPQVAEAINGKQAEASQTLNAAMTLQGLRR